MILRIVVRIQTLGTLYDDDDDDETWIYIAHCHKISNALIQVFPLVQKCLREHQSYRHFCTSGNKNIYGNSVPAPLHPASNCTRDTALQND